MERGSGRAGEDGVAAAGAGAFALACGVLLALFAALTLNTWQPWLLVDMHAEKAGTTQLFYAADGAWSEARSVSLALHERYDRLAFRLPEVPGRVVRFDPNTATGEYRIVRLRWTLGPFYWDVAPEQVTAVAQATLGARAGQAVVTATGDDAALLVPAPPRAWFVALRSLPALLVAAGLLYAWRRRDRATLPLHVAGAALAMWLLAYAAMTLQYGPIDPFRDDWRAFWPTAPTFLGLHRPWLGAITNDTYYWTGSILDEFVLWGSGEDFFILRLFALTLLAGFVLLWAQNLVRACRSSVATACVAVAACALVLASDGYWGAQAIAYHQFLPLLACAAMVALLPGAEAARIGAGRLAALALLAVLANLAYISGPLAVGALGLALCVAGTSWRRSVGTPWFRAGALLALLGLAGLVFQLTLVMRQQGSLLVHNQGAMSVYPSDGRFWPFFCALFGKALGYAGTTSLIDAAWTLFALAPALLLLPVWWRPGSAASAMSPLARALFAFAALLAPVYAAMLAFGRAGFVAAGTASAQTAWFAKVRFHYWWIAALLPLLWLGWAALVRALAPRRVWLARGVGVAAAAALLLPKGAATWDLAPFLLEYTHAAVPGSACLADTLRSGEGADCPELFGYTAVRQTYHAGLQNHPLLRARLLAAYPPRPAQ